MADDDDDLGGGTLVMQPEDRPPLSGGAPTPYAGPPAAPDPTNVDDPWDTTDAPGTFIMQPQDHTTRPSPASPFADKDAGAPPAAPVVIGRAPSHGFATAKTLAAGSEVFAEANAIIAERQRLDSAASMAGPPGVAPDGRVSDPHGGGFPPPGAYGAPDSAADTHGRGGSLAPLLLGAAVGLTTVTIVVGGYYAYRALTAPDAPPATSASVAPAPCASPPAATPQPPAASPPKPATSAKPGPAALPAAPAAAGGSEGAARAALEKLGAGIKTCVAETIGKLPGTAPAVPPAMSWLKRGPYKPGINDFGTPVYHCSRFKLDEPMPFVIQWQSDDAKGKKGTGTAWIDDDGDGKPDRAFGFTATLPKPRVAEIGPIEAVDPKKPIKKR